MEAQVAVALISSFAAVTTALLGFIAKEIAGLRHDLARHEARAEARHEDHEVRINALERRTA
jgi:hypothetical protein